MSPRHTARRGCRLASRAPAAPAFAAALLLPALTAPLQAQGMAAEVFAARQPALTSAALWGGALTVGDALGVRVGGGVGYAPAADLPADGRSSISAYAADVDLLLAPASSAQLRPYAFVGVGTLGRLAPDRVWERGTSLSFGGGVKVPLLEVLSIDGSSRYRVSAGDSAGFRGAFPGGMEYRLGVALHFGGSGAGHRGTSAGSGSFPWPLGGTMSGASSGSARAARVLPTAEQYLGVPYVWGGKDPRTGFDCSGFTQYVYRRHGVTLPRLSRDQARVGSAMPTDVRTLAPGDMIFFAADWEHVDHVAIYAGNGRIIHATSSGREVRYDDLATRRGQWFRDHMVAARRVIDDGGSLVRALEQTFRLVPEASFDAGDRAPRP